MLGEGIGETKAHDREFCGGSRGEEWQGRRSLVSRHGIVATYELRCGRRFEKRRQPVERIGTVKIVGVDNGEVLFDRVARTPHGVAGTPRFFAAGGRRQARRQGVERLEHIVDRDLARVARANLRAKQFLEIAPDHKHDATEAGPQRIEHGVVEHGLTRRTDRVDLFQPAVAGAHAGGQNEESGR